MSVSNANTISDLIDTQQAQELFDHFTALTGLPVRLTDPAGNEWLSSDPQLACACPLCELAQSSPSGAGRCCKAFVDGGLEAQRWGMPYFYQCWLSLMEWTVPLVMDDQIQGILVCGQVLIKDLDDLFYEEVIRECMRLGISLDQANEAIERVRVITPHQSRAAAELLQLIANQLSEEGARRLSLQRKRTEQQQRIAETIHHHKLTSQGRCYPIELETQLLGAVKLGEVGRAHEILNSLLGAIFLRDMGNLMVLKARLIELLAILSRASVEAGGELEATLGANLSFLQRINECHSIEEMSAVVIEALDRFTQGVYQTRNTEQLRILSDVLQYIREHATENLSVDEVARACHKNASTLRKLFREQLGQTFTDYLNRTRVNMAIDMLKDPGLSLAEIAVEVGFYDQSHFGKIFRQITGYTPALYRKKAL